MKKLKYLIASLILLQGCLNYTQITTIKKDGSGSMFIHYYMHWNSERDSSVIESLGFFNRDSVYKEFTSNYSKIKDVEVYKDNSDSTVHAKILFEFASLDSLNNANAFKGAELKMIDGEDDTKIFSQFIQPIATGFGFEAKNIKISYIYYLPGEILSHNATSVAKNELRWDYSLTEIGTGKYITATFRPFKLKETPLWIYIAAGFVLLIVIVYLFTKKSK